MKKVIVGIVVLVLLTVAVLLFTHRATNSPQRSLLSARKGEKETSYEVRPPAVAGAFYPSQADALKAQVDYFLKNAGSKKVKGKIVALIVPHAGYDYSGQVAAFAYKQLEGKHFNSVIIIGPSHYLDFEGASIYKEGYYKTPLGEVPLDEDLAQALIKEDKIITFYPQAHAQEHSVEVEIPFLQRVLKDFYIVPIVMGRLSEDSCRILSKAIVRNIKPNTLLIASSDMSHYYPYEKAYKMDGICLEKIGEFNLEGLTKKLFSGECELCGAGPVITVMMAARALGADKVEVLNYANSGDVMVKDKSRVVGYCAVVITSSLPAKQQIGLPGPDRRQAGKGLIKKEGGKMLEFELNEEEKKELLRIARRTIEEYLRTGKKLKFEESSANLIRECGAFVTLKRGGELRGCIGNIKGQKPLYLTVRDMAIAAATEDFRFSPVKEKELKEIHIEVSVLSPLKKIKDVKEIEVGVHGVIIEKGLRSGVFLPQVAPEQGWNREEMLKALCAHKAGLPADAWKSGADIYIFTAQVFEEEE